MTEKSRSLDGQSPHGLWSCPNKRKTKFPAGLTSLRDRPQNSMLLFLVIRLGPLGKNSVPLRMVSLKKQQKTAFTLMIHDTKTYSFSIKQKIYIHIFFAPGHFTQQIFHLKSQADSATKLSVKSKIDFFDQTPSSRRKLL